MSIKRKTVFTFIITLAISFSILGLMIITQISSKNSDLINKIVENYERSNNQSVKLLVENEITVEKKLNDAENSIKIILNEVYEKSYDKVAKSVANQIFPLIANFDFFSADGIAQALVENTDEITWAQYSINKDAKEDDLYEFGKKIPEENSIFFSHEIYDDMTYVKLDLQVSTEGIEEYLGKVKDIFLSVVNENEMSIAEVKTKGLEFSNESEYFANKSSADSISQLTVNIIIIMTVILAAVCTLIYFVIRSITIPILKNVNFAKEISSGELNHVLEVQRNDEIGNLSGSLNTIVKNLSGIVKNIMLISDSVKNNSLELSSTVHEENQLAEIVVKKISEIEKESLNISNSFENVSGNVLKVALSAKDLTKASEEISVSAEKSKKFVSESNEAAAAIEQNMEKVSLEMDLTARGVEGLVDNINNVEKILVSINAIAEQTNLLALNAAIEAARAGESGKGFTVVAEEIRKLAEDSKESTREVEKILKEIFANSEEVKGKTITVSEKVKQATYMSVNVRDKLNELFLQIENMVRVSHKGFDFSKQQKKLTDEISEEIEISSKSTQYLVEKQHEISNLIGKFKKGIDKVENTGNTMLNSSETLNNSIKQFKISDQISS